MRFAMEQAAVCARVFVSIASGRKEAKENHNGNGNANANANNGNNNIDTSGIAPMLVQSDDISFQKPVGIGKLLSFTSKVTYTEGPFVQVKCVAQVYDLGKKEKFVSNKFDFTYIAANEAARNDHSVSDSASTTGAKAAKATAKKAAGKGNANGNGGKVVMNLPPIIPDSYEEVVLHLDGRRRYKSSAKALKDRGSVYAQYVPEDGGNSGGADGAK
jgi:acyl-CoA hydrolase